MKTKLLIFTIAIMAISCKSHEATVAESNRTSNNSTSSRVVYSPEINNHINQIISQHLDIPITSIARSDIRETEDGYFLKFLNVRTGEKYIFNTDFEFSAIKISKNTIVSF